MRRTKQNETDQVGISKLIQDVKLRFNAVLDGGVISARELLDLEPGSVLVFDHPIDRPGKSNAQWTREVDRKRRGKPQQAVFSRLR